MTGQVALHIDTSMLSPTVTGHSVSDSALKSAAVTTAFWSDRTLTTVGDSFFATTESPEPAPDETVSFWT
jgi:hypothetical protein